MKKVLSVILAALTLCLPMAALGESDALIVYFSCTGNTQSAAEALAQLTGADVARIEPAAPYTADDLNYNDKNSRANLEVQDAAARPEIAGEIADFDSYSVVYVGYPIWWGDLPPILRTFAESYDFTGKTVMPFCTSGGSGVATSVDTLRGFLPGADVRDGLRVTASDRESQLQQWLADEGMNVAAGKLYLRVGDSVLTATLADNSSADALRDMLSKGPVTVDMHDFSNFEKVGELGQTLPTNDESITTQPGDLILYQGSRFVIYYDTNTWDFTRLGRLDDVSEDELKALLGDGDVSVTLSLEPSAQS